jgi:VWFA-related protein
MRNRAQLRAGTALAMALVFAGTTHTRQAGMPPAEVKPTGDSAATERQKPGAEPRAEVPSQEVPTIKLRVNLVQVKVVVRDQKGEVVKNLQRGDFQVYDQGKLQMISTFGIETPETLRKRAEEEIKTQTGKSPAEAEKAGMPQRYVAVVFDDVHLQTGDILPVRAGAEKLIDNLKTGDRIGIFSTSGQMTEDFTSEKETLKKKLRSLSARPIVGKINSGSTCPEVSYYMADQYFNQANNEVLKTATEEVLECDFRHDAKMAGPAQAVAKSLLKQQLMAGNADNETSYRRMEDVLREVSRKPGERVVILVSPGFLLASLYSEETGVIERANRAGIVINSVDARGLFSPESAANDISKPVTDTMVARVYKADYRAQEQIDADGPLRDLAESTGGTFFHNSNDLAGGLQQLGAAPEVSYLLGYSPEGQKMDGKYHLIKVVITGNRKYEVQARHGYFAPKKVNNRAEKVDQEIHDAVYSQDEIADLPLEIHTKYFKNAGKNAELNVTSHVGVKGLQFRQADGKNCDELTVTTVIFGENGELVSGEQKLLNLQLPDAAFQQVSQYGLRIDVKFELKPGSYTVRQVVREAEGAKMAAKNRAVVIPE